MNVKIPMEGVEVRWQSHYDLHVSCSEGLRGYVVMPMVRSSLLSTHIVVKNQERVKETYNRFPKG